MSQSVLNSFKAHCRYIVKHPMFLSGMMAPFIIIILLKLIFPPLSHFIFLKAGFDPDSYYSLTAITLISFIPVIIGIVFSFNLSDEKDQTGSEVNEGSAIALRNLLYIRMIISSFLCFIIVLITIILTKPVPTEGWLRTLFAAFLFSIQTAIVFLLNVTFSEHERKGLMLSGFYFVFLMTVPLGLLLHHPWNYFAFFSPLYWEAWAWIVTSPLESLVYGSITVFLSVVILIILYRGKMKESFG